MPKIPPLHQRAYALYHRAISVLDGTLSLSDELFEALHCLGLCLDGVEDEIQGLVAGLVLGH